jgi:DNA-binding Xre family transcriptional regulator
MENFLLTDPGKIKKTRNELKAHIDTYKVKKDEVIKILEGCCSFVVIDKKNNQLKIKSLEEVCISLKCEPWIIYALMNKYGFN